VKAPAHLWKNAKPASLGNSVEIEIRGARSNMHLQWTASMLKTRYKLLAHLFALIPLLLMIYDVFCNRLGADPVRTLTHRTGWWALVFLMLSLAMTPLRRITGQARFIQLRRMLGLWCFVLVSCHLTIYVVLDLQSAWRELWTDIVKRPYITVGFTAWLLLIPLVLTSTQLMMKKLGRNWAKLHRLVYVIAVLGVVHFLWLVKKDLTEPLIFAGVLALLLGIRVFYAMRKNNEAKQRPSR
jgi:methionine sulfoxide reductase heme-binding subunit